MIDQAKIYVPADAVAVALGANDVAAEAIAIAVSKGVDAELVRNGSRGLLWLEPLVEVAKNGTRFAYGPVGPGQLESVLEHALSGNVEQHSLFLGDIEQHPLMAAQQRLTFERCGLIDPLSFADYKRTGGMKGIEAAVQLTAEKIVEVVTASGLRGRGGAAFPTGIKWNTVLNSPVNEVPGIKQKYIVCNADEGDSGTFADRMLMEGDPFCLIEGMAIAALAVGAEQGYIYLRSEYPHAAVVLTSALKTAREEQLLGENVCGSGRRFDIELRMGAGAYICGEETSLLDSLEGKRGMVRAKPPLPAISGLFGQPSVINNVLSLAAVPTILANGAEAYQAYGSGRSRGTLPIQLAGNVKQGGLFEVAFGLSLREVVEQFGLGTASGRPVRAIQVGGPLGAYMPEAQWDTPLDYEAMAEVGAMLGHGGIVVFDDTADMLDQAQFAMEFCAVESCGKCTPCRIGSVRGVETLEKIKAGDNRDANLILLEELCDTMRDASLCAMGGLTPNPVRSALAHFPEDFAGSSS